jgi:hypothetical protein
MLSKHTVRLGVLKSLLRSVEPEKQLILFMAEFKHCLEHNALFELEKASHLACSSSIPELLFIAGLQELAKDEGLLEQVQHQLQKLFACACGSGVNDSPLRYVACANKTKQCQREAKMPCGKCHLVSYCSQSCLREHESAHHEVCSHPILNASWKPIWEVEQRVPSFFAGYGHTTFLASKHIEYL